MTGREFKFRRKEFNAIRGIVYERTGIRLRDNKEEMVYTRLSRRIRALGMSDFKSYLEFLHSEEGAAETVDFVNAMTTNLTRFFREAHHFQHLRHQVLRPRVDAARQGRGDKKLRIWSAGCSSGMEPYSIAMTVRASLPRIDGWDVKILATDIDTNMLNKGKAALYRAQDVEAVPPALLERFVSIDGEHAVMSEDIRELISFKYLNFKERWPITKSFDVIFCRNVLIYFDKETQKRIVEGFIRLLKPDGVLYVGHAEALVANFKELVGVGRSTFMVASHVTECV